MKVFILTDLEGPSGVNGRSDGIGNTILNQPTAAAALVNEVNACCEGLFEAGADEVVVLDGHGGSNSIDVFKLHPRARLMQVGEWNPAVYLDSTFDACIQIGAHAMQSSGGYLCHTFNSHGLAEMRLNGKQIGEIGMAGYQAAYFHVPTILFSGDEAACREAKAFFGSRVEVVPTKAGINRYAAVNYPPETVYAALRKSAAAALKKYQRIPIPKLPGHLELQVRVMCPNQALAAEKLGIRRLDEVTLLFEADDFVEIFAQRLGWAPGVHQKKFNMSPEWRFPFHR